MSRSSPTLGDRRREQIVEAALAVIAEQGLQNLSLSEIEKRADMSRGHLTYYFHTKEDILLAVFDRVVAMMHARVGTPGGLPSDHEGVTGAWPWIEHLLRTLLTEPDVGPEFECLQFTFLAQIAHREDFRQRLAALYEMWRSNMGRGLEEDVASGRAANPVSPRAFASL